MPLEPLPDDWQRGLCVVAHPDDIEYGLGAAVARWTASGKDIRYVLVTRGEAGIDGMEPSVAGPLREQEELAGARVVGVDSVEFLDDHPDGVIEYGLPLRRDLTAALRRHRPEMVCSLNFRDRWGSGGRNSPDHRHVGVALLDAVGDAGNRWVFSAFGEPWKGVHWVAFGGSPEPTHFVDVTGHLDRAVESLRAHAAYIDGLGTGFDADEFLRSNATAAGTRSGCDHAIELELFAF